MIVTLIEKVYSFLWGDLVQIPLPGGSTLGISLLIILLIPTGIYFTVRTRFLPIRLFPDMVQALVEKKQQKNSLSSFQTLIVSTATRVGMGNLVGVVAAISAGGAGAVFWMWVTAIIGSSTAFIEATLAQLYKEKDPLYGGYRGGPAYYIHAYVEEKQKKKFGGISGYSPGMPPSFRSEKSAEGGGDSPLLPAPRPGHKEERTSDIGQKKESEKLRFGKFRGKPFTGKPEALSP